MERGYFLPFFEFITWHCGKDFTVFGDSHKNTGFICEYGTSRNISASDFSPSKTFEYNGIKYEVYTDSVDLPTAQQICKLKKGRLAIVENETENNAIVEAISLLMRWYSDVNSGRFVFADFDAILPNFVSISSSVPEYG